MSGSGQRGAVYSCPICGAEILVLGRRTGAFFPVCCNRRMDRQTRKGVFFVCPICGAEVVRLTRSGSAFVPRCCNVDMILEAA